MIGYKPKNVFKKKKKVLEQFYHSNSHRDKFFQIAVLEL